MQPLALTRNSFEHRGFELSYLDTDPQAGEKPVVLLLHGFPDTAEMWHAVIAPLHAAGYRCVAPDTLGCGESAMAPRTQDYQARKIAGDHAALLRHLKIDKAHVVGHDWGAVVAWLIAIYHPQCVDRLVPISVGHPTAYARAEFRQKLIGWYVLYFLLVGVADRLLQGQGPLSMRRVFASHPDMDEVEARMRVPGRLTAALSIYRASLVEVLVRTHQATRCDTLGIYSDGDRFLVESQMKRSERWVDGHWEYQGLAGGHWIPLEQPERLARLLLDFFAS
ncbi:MAG: hypothetical protein CMP06_07170 [Xanthomonadales bacterium]|nr:hypothetical protein [Xanthomonadales bacterium]